MTLSSEPGDGASSASCRCVRALASSATVVRSALPRKWRTLRSAVAPLDAREASRLRDVHAGVAAGMPSAGARSFVLLLPIGMVRQLQVMRLLQPVVALVAEAHLPVDVVHEAAHLPTEVARLAARLSAEVVDWTERLPGKVVR